MDLTSEALAHNRGILGPKTLGVEVTLKTFARRCGLGNVDPQHPDNSADSKSSAAEESLVLDPPEDGATMATIREDPDAIIFMAVMALRAEGRDRFINRPLVEWVGKRDF